MARFNRNAPFDNVGGAPGAAYLQNGHYFNNGGVEVEIVYEGEGDARHPLGRIKDGATSALTVDEEDEISNSVDKPTDPAHLHWRHLKALVEQFGGTWTNREAALAFLEGREKPTDEEEAA
jgi:hypothetical protein